MRWFALPLLWLSACGDSSPSDSALPQCDDVSIDLPSGRGEVQAGWDASQQRLVVFGGNEAEPINCSPGATEFDGATWAWRDACDGFVAIDPADAPSKRGRYAAATDTASGRLLIHGGRFRKGDSGDYTLHGDVWAFDFATDSWSKLAGSAAGPSPRFDHGAAVVDGKLWIFGGNDSTNGANFSPNDDTWAFDLASNTWEEVTTTNAPPRRLYHAVSTDGARLFVYGGGDENALFGNNFLGDLWALDLDSGAWTELHPDNGEGPLGRIWTHLAHDAPRDRLVLFAGHNNGNLGNDNELWQFNLNNNRWKRLKRGDKENAPANGVCDFPADFTTIDEDSPERRSAAAWAVTDDDRLLVFGGKTDCGNANDVWALDLTTDSWTRRSRATEGEVCLRAYQECSSMCF